MVLKLNLETILPLIIAPYCINLGILVLSRLRSINKWTESIIFFFLTITAALWSLGPFLDHYIPSYGWITAVFLTNTAIIYTIVITSKKWIKLFLPIAVSGTAYVFYCLFNGEGADPGFPMKFTYSIFPLLVLMNIIVYSYYFRYKTRFHLTIAVMTSFMILGGFYDTFKNVNNWPAIPAASLGSFAFVFVAGYQLLIRGYLQNQGWRDYAVALEQKERLMVEKFFILKKANLDSVIVLSQTIEAKDPYTRGHCLRVRDFAKTIGIECGFSKQHLQELEFGAILHDIGKIGVAGSILNKQSKLTDEEFAEIKKHPDIGANIISNVEFFQPMIPIVRHHHEFYNGQGYPQGLKEKDIPLEARILSVSDVFDAITSDRPYRKAYSIEEALVILKELAGTQLDPEMVHLFVEMKVYLLKHDSLQKLTFDF